ncbi:MAG TPA: hydantoinase/oxoprolinase family protein [Ramlibacter sp.]|uniref:hydantoinase/oxoprolinase family protein n=1 Tax=Ramlibacter sp. TaxID=1917967 RepID=UPI002B9B0100|nr:hydantoinase/oxoprolinase family protein [Ramlibacter sp.]HVZ43576.1 hydantoinase/oxoprolinase family protein [Ramlibacter sp.]
MNGARRNLLAVDIGGSFTDVVLQASGRRFTAKALTTPHAPEEGVMAGIAEILAQASLGAGEVSLFILGTTLATNALIERKGARTALLATEGFRDVLEIGHENRYAQYDIAQDKPPPLVPRFLRFGVPERVNVRGEVLLPLDEDAVRALIPQLRSHNVESVAVAFLHSYANPAHEVRVRELLAAELPGVCVTLSSDVCPEVREYERTSTACANAYVQPVVAGYLGRLRERLAAAGLGCPFYLMTSGGAITTVESGAAEPIKLVESGPAGGAILAAQVAKQCGVHKALSFDMGGTTAKICFIDDYEPELSRTFEVGRMYRFMKGSGIPVRIPVIEMVEIGAGGGSIARVDAMGRVQVGPESAVSDPGPACFGRGGARATVTDADCLSGLLDAQRFASGKVRLRPAMGEEAIARDVGDALGVSAIEGATAIQEVVAENMANAARVHAAELGKTVEDYTMIAFGGAAPLHAAQLAAKLGIARVIVPVAASVGSALGFLWAPVAWQSLRSLHQRLDAFDGASVDRLLQQMEAQARDAVVRAAGGDVPLQRKRIAYMRYVGQGHEIAVELPEGSFAQDATGELRRRFEASYIALYGRVIPHLVVEAMSWSVTVGTLQDDLAAATMPQGAGPARAASHRQVFDTTVSQWVDAGVYDRASLEPGAAVAGPALVAEDQTTTVVPLAFVARVNSLGHLVVEREGEAA